ncbi:MAG: hypothetical protein JRI25_07740 [Deltaproteobacteria bacterium]|nr:hypothetical protein [Deltaproteobacteria bacterium]
MTRLALLLAVPAVVACNLCPAGTRLVEIPVSATETEKVCRSEGGITHGPYWRYVGGNLVEEGGYEFGERTGSWVTYGPDGAMIELHLFDDNQKVGTWKQWSEGGQLLSEVTYDRDRKHGVERSWYENGQLAVKGGNVEGRHDGVWTAWYENGHRKWERNFDLGIRDGAWTEWSEDGRPLVRGIYVEGERDGLWEEWYPSGQPRLRISYDRGVPGPHRYFWDENGNPKAPVTSGEIRPSDLTPYLVPANARPPDPRVAWAFEPPTGFPLGSPAEVRDVVLVSSASRLYGLKVNDPAQGWELDAPESLSVLPPAVQGDQALLWTVSGQLLVVGPTRVEEGWSLHQLDADLSVRPAIADPHVAFVGRDNHVKVYDRVQERVLWSRPVEGEALVVGIAPEKAWVLSTAGKLVTYALGDGEQLVSTDFTTEKGQPRWTSRPTRDFLLYWWNGDQLEAVRPVNGEVAWTWHAPPEFNPEESRLARVSTRFGDLGVFSGHRVYYLDSAQAGALEATSETFAEQPPAEFSSCVSWGVQCVRADRNGSIEYPGGRPYLGTGLASEPALGADRLWVVSDRGWLARVDFEPAMEVHITPLALGKEDEDRLRVWSDADLHGPLRKVRWVGVTEPWEQLAVDIGPTLPPGARLEATLSLAVGRPTDWGLPKFADGWVIVARSQHQEAHYRYRLYREVRDLNFPDLSADRLDTILRCQDKEKTEVSGSMEIMGLTRLGGAPLFTRRLEGTFRIGSAAFAKACAMIVSYQDPETGRFRRLGAYGPPGRPFGTTQKARLELHGADQPRRIGSRASAVPPGNLGDVAQLRLIQESGFGPTKVYEVVGPTAIEMEEGTWSISSERSPVVRIELPELALDSNEHEWEGTTFEVMTWRVRSAPFSRGMHPVVPIYTRVALPAAEPEPAVSADNEPPPVP